MSDTINKDHSTSVNSSFFFTIKRLILLPLFFIPYLLNDYPAFAKNKVYYGIHVGSYKGMTKAAVEVSRLKKRGYNAFYQYKEVKGKGMWYRVYIDKCVSKREAKVKARRLKRKGIISDYFIRTITDKVESTSKDEMEKRDMLHVEPKRLEKKAHKSTHLPKPPQKKPEELITEAKQPLIIDNITYKLEKGKKETVYIHSNINISPSVIAIEGEKPRVVIEIKNITAYMKDLSKIRVDGEFIEQIQASLHDNGKTLMVVLELSPSIRYYDVGRILYEDEHIYALEVMIKHKPKVTEKVAEKEEPSRDEKPHALAEVSEEREELREEAKKGIVLSKKEKMGKKVKQWRLTYFPSNIKVEKLRLRRKAEEMSEGDALLMLMKNNFYSSCWTYNRDFCNPDGDFNNSFIDNGDGTITDRATGLMWQKGGSFRIMTWENGYEYVQQLNYQNFAGYSDWRVPKLEELASIIEHSWKNGDLFIDTVFDKRQKSCWSANTHGSDRAWKANFHFGYIIDTPLKYENSVRAVRLKMDLPNTVATPLSSSR